MNEDAIHQQIAQYLGYYLPNEVVWFHVPNGGNLPVQFKVKLKRRGVKPGIPDIMICWPMGWGGLEIKKKGGRLSSAQKDMRDQFAEAGGKYAVSRSIEDVQETLKEWGIGHAATN